LQMNQALTYFWYYFSIQFNQIFMYWIIGMLIGSAVSVFLKDAIHGALLKLGTDDSSVLSGVSGIIIASFLGIASPLCMYGTIPIAASFSRSGIKDDWLAAFMMTSILLNPQLIIYSAALGPAALGIRIGSCFICGIAAGILIRIFCRKASFFNFQGFDEPENHDTDPNLMLRYIKNLWRNFKATGVYFLAGIALSALFQEFVPASVMTAVFGGNRFFGVLMAATIGVPLYACGGGTIPILQQWLYEGMSLGSAAAFMITGPATKITNLGALKIVLGMKHFGIYIAFVMIFSLFTGIIIDLFL